MNAFKTDLKRALTSWAFIVAVVGMAVAALFGVGDKIISAVGEEMAQGLEQGYTIQLAMEALRSDVVLLVLPILCALPFTAAFLDDFKSRYIREYLPRCGKNRYVGAKVLSTALAGGLALFLGVILMLIVFALIFVPWEKPPVVPELSPYEQQMMEMMGEGGNQADVGAQINFMQFMQRAFLFFLNGCLWSLLGGLLAAITMSKYMAYAAPFIFYYVLVILSERYFGGLYVINPKAWLNPGEEWLATPWGAALLVAELAVLAALLYSIVIRRRLKDA